MSRITEAFMLCTGVLVVGCLDAEPELEMAEPEAAKPTNLICGENTVASARTPSGNRMVFCVHDDVEVIAEGGTAEPLPIDSGACGLDVFLALTDSTTPVPARLVAACVDRGRVTPVIGRIIVDEPVFTAFPEGDLALFNSHGAQYLDYCGSDGQDKFLGDWEWRCENGLTGGTYCGTWNMNGLEPTHLKKSWDTLGEQINIAKSSLASCNGSTRFRGQRDRGAIDSTYVTMFDVVVPSNNSWVILMSYRVNGEDAHFQFRGDGYNLAKHRYAGVFEDQKY